MTNFVAGSQDSGRTETRSIGSASPSEQGVSEKRPCLFLGVLGLLVVACWCIATAGFCSITSSLGAEEPRIEQVLDRFMTAGKNKDGTAMLSLFAQRGLEGTSPGCDEEMLKGNNYALFEGYLELSLTDLEYSFQFPEDPEYARGLVATVSATLAYEQGFSGDLNAVLEKDGDAWYIWAIQVTVPPRKIAGPAGEDLRQLVKIDAKSCRCYTSSGSWSLASPWILLHGRTTWALEAGQATRANRLTAGPSFARLAFLFVSRSFGAVAHA